MAGKRESKEKLNSTLLNISRVLNRYNFKPWFIAYGTLLGVVRNNSCIEGDDDIDIICDRKKYKELKEILLKENYLFYEGNEKIFSTNLLKTKASINSASIDFYMAEVDEDGNFNDLWEKVIWSSCYIDGSNNLVKLNWNNTTINLPANFITKLKRRYGFLWRIPQKNKSRLKKRISRKINIFIVKLYNQIPQKFLISFKFFIKKNNIFYNFIKSRKIKSLLKSYYYILINRKI